MSGTEFMDMTDRPHHTTARGGELPPLVVKTHRGKNKNTAGYSGLAPAPSGVLEDASSEPMFERDHLTVGSFWFITASK